MTPKRNPLIINSAFWNVCIAAEASRTCLFVTHYWMMIQFSVSLFTFMASQMTLRANFH